MAEKKKIHKVAVTSTKKFMNLHSDKLGDCIDYLYVDTTICENGLGEQMLIILNGVVSVIGYRFKSEDFRNPENKKKYNNHSVKSTHGTVDY